MIAATKVLMAILGLGVGIGCAVFADKFRKDTAAWWLSPKGLWAYRLVGGGVAVFSLWVIAGFLKLI